MSTRGPERRVALPAKPFPMRELRVNDVIFIAEHGDRPQRVTQVVINDEDERVSVWYVGTYNGIGNIRGDDYSTLYTLTVPLFGEVWFTVDAGTMPDPVKS